jgi:hypothetical protein
MSLYRFSYNYDSLNDAFNIENRKGKIQKKNLSPEYLNAAQEYREMRKVLKRIFTKKKAERTEDEQKRVTELQELMKENILQQKYLLRLHLTNTSKRILSSSFRFTLTPDDSKDKNKPLYAIGSTPEEYFAMQVLCRNVKKLFNISMAGREEILSQLKLLLQEDKSRFYIIRTDVSHCFESIPHEKLFGYLESNSLLDVKSKALLRGLIKKEFEEKNLRPLVKKINTGIPRGCAISSLLSEFYLSKIDDEIKRELPGVVFMGRYVDDMILVIHPDIDEANQRSLDQYMQKLIYTYDEKELVIHFPTDGTGKCYTYDSVTKKKVDFNLLGYNIQVLSDDKNRKVTFSLSDDKIKRIKERIDKTLITFDELVDKKGYDVAAHYLFDALHVLTCNINLYNAKKGVKVGFYYSNQLLDNMDNVYLLDDYLKDKIKTISLQNKSTINSDDQADLTESLKNKLQQVSFTEGFTAPHKRYKIKKHKLQMIKASWMV